LVPLRQNAITVVGHYELRSNVFNSHRLKHIAVVIPKLLDNLVQETMLV
jgi:hypothetical protein